jgi:hypothetical protein
MADQAKTAAEAFAENFTEATDTTAAPDSPADATASYLEARGQYGTTRILHIPDGRVEHAHFGYLKPSPRSHHHARQSGHHRESQNWARPSHPGFRDSSWEVKSSGNDPIAPANWWHRFWRSVGVNLRDR